MLLACTSNRATSSERRAVSGERRLQIAAGTQRTRLHGTDDRLEPNLHHIRHVSEKFVGIAWIFSI